MKLIFGLAIFISSFHAFSESLSNISDENEEYHFFAKFVCHIRGFESGLFDPTIDVWAASGGKFKADMSSSSTTLTFNKTDFKLVPSSRTENGKIVTKLTIVPATSSTNFFYDGVRNSPATSAQYTSHANSENQALDISFDKTIPTAKINVKILWPKNRSQTAESYWSLDTFGSIPTTKNFTGKCEILAD